MIVIKWKNQNTNLDGHRIYRSEQPIDRSNLPEIHDVIAGNVDSYTDETTVRGKTYYYVVEPYRGSESYPSNNIKARAMPKTGPGPQELLYGDYDLGYFGRVPRYDFITPTTLIGATGIGGTLYNSSAYLTEWFKFAYKGKILFIPVSTLTVNSVSWDNLYARGMINHEEGGHGYNPSTGGKYIRYKGDTFAVRLIKGGNDRTLEYPGISNSYRHGTNPVVVTAGLEGSEWNDLMYRVCRPHGVVDQTVGSWDDVPAGEIITFASNNYSVLCQESIGNHSLVRGNHSYVVYAYYSTTNSTTNNWWKPVLELIPSE